MTSMKRDGRVEFRFYRPDATNVKVVGTFNNWNADALAMRPLTGGWWAADATIDAGEHHFRYIADGHWYTDFAANGVMRNKYGWNSILIVPEKRLRLPVPVLADDREDDTQSEAIAA